jgi:hypothetical protein
MKYWVLLGLTILIVAMCLAGSVAGLVRWIQSKLRK